MIFSHDAERNILSVANPLDSPQSYRYSNGMLTGYTDSAGSRTTLAYQQLPGVGNYSGMGGTGCACHCRSLSAGKDFRRKANPACTSFTMVV